MDNLNNIIATNIAFFRKKSELTQSELASMLNYSDKAVSKWERGESVPDIYVLKQIADIFNITVDTLITPKNLKRVQVSKHISLSKAIIILLSGLLVWLIATITFVVLSYTHVDMAWFSFIVAVPVSLLVVLILTSIWGKKWVFFMLLSLFLWSVFVAIYVGIIKLDLWLIFIIGIPLQIGIILWYILSKHKEKVRKYGK
ncbi:MAG: helix-turn-helix domain-containing protein [Clostridia bacterium]|nr:helix-turn-helix domain-containing protein [Clostridia bacterium]